MRGAESNSRLRSAAQVCELGDRAIIGPLKRLEEAGSLFLVKRNRRLTDERPLALVVTAPGLRFDWIYGVQTFP